ARAATPAAMQTGTGPRESSRTRGPQRDPPRPPPQPPRNVSGKESVGGDRGHAEVALQESKELAVRLEHENIALPADRLTIREHAPVEAIELRILAVRPRVDLRGSGIPVAANPLGPAIGLGQDDLALPLGVGLVPLGLLLALRPKLRGDSKALLAHTLIDRIGDLVGQLDALHPHIDDLHPELGRALLRLDEHRVDQLRAIRRYDLLHRSPADRGLDAFLDDRGQPLPGIGLVGANGPVILSGIGD